MPLNLKELMWIIKAITGWSDAKIAEEFGTNDRYVGDIRKGLREPKQAEKVYNNVVNYLSLRFCFPWCTEAQPHIYSMMDLIRKEDFAEFFDKHGFFGQLILDHLLNIAVENDTYVRASQTLESKSTRPKVPLSSIQKTPTFWSEVFIGLYFAVALSHPKCPKGLPQNPKSLQLDTDELIHIYAIALDLLGKPSDNEDPWKVVLRGKVFQLLLAAKWNTIDPNAGDLAYQEIGKWVDATCILDRLAAYIELVPQVYEAPFGALAVASRLKKQERYPELLRSLQKQKAEPRFLSLSGIEEMRASTDDDDFYFNADFADFISWAKANAEEFFALERA